jgi:VWFA-related protein
MIGRPRPTLVTVVVVTCFVLLCVPAVAQSPDLPAIIADAKSDALSADFVFQTRVDEVRLLFTVVDHKGKFIRDLKLDDLQLLDEQRPPDKINAFQQETNLPLRVALLVDISASVTDRFKYEQQAAIEFFKKILRPSVDKAMVIGFNENVHFEQDLTNNVEALKAAVKRLKPHGNTAIFDAIVFASNKLRVESDKNTRKVIVLISDGENNGGRAIMNDAQQAALRAEAPIYSLSANDLDGGGYTKGEATLELLSRNTGGEILPAHEKTEVAHAFKQVEQALRSQYVLAYKPAEFVPDGRYRRVALTSRKPKLNVECRHGYYASKE